MQAFSQYIDIIQCEHNVPKKLLLYLSLSVRMFGFCITTLSQLGLVF